MSTLEHGSREIPGKAIVSTLTAPQLTLGPHYVEMMPEQWLFRLTATT